MIKAGEVVFIKTTGEAVFVLEDREKSNIEVRRPVAGQNGIEHVVDQFREMELETIDDQQARFMSERKAVMEKYGPKVDQPETLANSGFGIN